VAGFVDAHVHCWAAGPNRAAFPPAEALREARRCGVTRIVLVQPAVYGFDNSYMLDAMASHPGVFGGIAVLDPGSPETPRKLRAMRESGVRGLRIRLGDFKRMEDSAPLWRAAVEAGVAVCLLASPDHAPFIAPMCRRFPEATVVVDHMARGADLRAFSRHPRGYVKISAFYAFSAGPPYTDLLPAIARLLGDFGPRRLMWGSDAPFQVQEGRSYETSLALVRDLVPGVSAAERGWLLGGTAAALFFPQRKSG
jgi:predicted TIM-barrel fold metal-dependent hydrolase